MVPGAAVVVTAAGAAGLLFKGAPTAISQRWFGSPCGGFMPGAVFVVVGTSFIVTCGCALTVVGCVATGAGLLFKGAPTEISQRWPGCPCGGFIPGAVAVCAAVCVIICGLVTTALFCGFIVTVCGCVMVTGAFTAPGITVVAAGAVVPGMVTWPGVVGLVTTVCTGVVSVPAGIIDLSTTSLSVFPPQDTRPAIAINPAAAYNFIFIRFILVAQFTGK